MSGPINTYEPRPAAPAPPHRSLLIESAGLLVAVSPLCAWFLREILPSSALLASLFLASVFAGTAWAMKQNIHETFLPVLPAVRLTLVAGLGFTAASLFSQAAFIWLPRILAETAVMPCAWLIPLEHLNLAASLCFLLLLTLAAANACLLCTGKASGR